jgi:hypothetical protein
MATLVLFALPVHSQARAGGRSTAFSRGFGHTAVVGHGGGFFPRSGARFRTFPTPFFPRRFGGHNRFFLSGSFGSPYYGYYGGYSYPAVNYDYSYPASRYYPPLDQSYPLDSSYVSDPDAQRRVETKLDRLQDQIERFLDEQYDREHAAPVASPGARTSPSHLTSLVFRDQHTEQTQNYAIVGQTLWMFTQDRARKIPLSDLDLPATTRLNQEQGVDFQLPAAQ